MIQRDIELSANEAMTLRTFASGSRDEIVPRLQAHFRRILVKVQRDFLGTSARQLTDDDLALTVESQIASIIEGYGQEADERGELHLLQLTSGAEAF